MRILLVDDDATFLEITGRLLRRSGHELITAFNPHEGLALLREARAKELPFQVVLSDWQMPEMTGPDFCRAIRAEFGRDPYFILLTGLGESARLDGLHSGADDFLSKPFESSDLHGSLRAAELILSPKSQPQKQPQRRAV
jgi:sigma-B regulation protein RsbU (phosphoserine phosphatase)